MNFIKISNKDYEMMDAPVTQAEWSFVMQNNPSYFKEKMDNPVETVSFNDVQEFIKKLNKNSETYIYRLPTEEEWGYCCRAGSKTNYYWGDKIDDDYCWHYENSNNTTQSIRQKKPNAFGLYDMSGNVWEWTDSTWSKDSSVRVLRGGSWNNNAQNLHSANRNNNSPDKRNNHVGFRLLRALKTCDSYPLTLNKSELSLALATAKEAINLMEKLLNEKT